MFLSFAQMEATKGTHSVSVQWVLAASGKSLDPRSSKSTGRDRELCQGWGRALEGHWIQPLPQGRGKDKLAREMVQVQK